MVRERQSARPRPKAPTRPRTKPLARRRAGSIWDTPRVKKVLAQPVGSPIDLTPEEMQAIVEESFGRGRGKGEDGARYVRRIRRESGALLIRPDA
jgi:hypothetical protein